MIDKEFEILADNVEALRIAISSLKQEIDELRKKIN
jgi:prefoldin subunit 5